MTVFKEDIKRVYVNGDHSYAVHGAQFKVDGAGTKGGKCNAYKAIRLTDDSFEHCTMVIAKTAHEVALNKFASLNDAFVRLDSNYALRSVPPKHLGMMMHAIGNGEFFTGDRENGGEFWTHKEGSLI